MLVDASDCFRATNQAGRMTGTGRKPTHDGEKFESPSPPRSGTLRA